ncbi:MAG: NAD(+)/NADH kinase [Defluviitaleaceae bacterium]|nr:NAD(+)/NADH kinase [Defluviitaleaceae bacterium]
MRKVGIIANTTKNEAAIFAIQLAAWFLKCDCHPLISSDVTVPLEFEDYSCDQSRMFDICDFVVVLGGDGTMLNTASLAATHDIPLLGINMGRLGYLTDVDTPEAFNSIEKVLQGEYKEEKRMMLSVDIEGKPDAKKVALNDVVVASNPSFKMVSAEIWINGEYIDTYRADGIMISTPTGSTAYNLSAGGPILEPTVEMMIITLICPHLIYARPYVISANDTINIIITGDHADESKVVVDGQNAAELKSGDKIIISRSEYYTRTIRTTSLGFYDILRQKMMRLHD